MDEKIKQFSKKLAVFTGIIFVIALIVSTTLFVYFNKQNGVQVYDWALLITIVTASAAPFATCIATYMSKSKAENKIKLQIEFMKEKFKMLQEMGVLTPDRAQAEMENEMDEVESNIDSIEENAEVENIYF